MSEKIVLAGGTGFIGTYLREKFHQSGHRVYVISRSGDNGHIAWEERQKIEEALNGASMLINLAGKSVDCRYTDRNKKKIFSSRLETTRTLGELILQCQNPPPLWLNASTATIYRHAEDRPMTDSKGEIGTGFSVEVAKQWESTFFQFSLPHTRRIALRMAIVLGEEGAMKPLTMLAKLGLGGKQGNGHQMFSWIHIEDLYNIISFLQKKSSIDGPINCSSPGPQTNAEVMRIIRSHVGMPFGLPSPKWLLELGAVIIGTETELVLKSRWVLPERLEEEGFKFKFESFEGAVEDILKE